jgi:hypothetical protein
VGRGENENIISQDRGRQHQRKGDNGFYQKLSFPSGKRQPISKRKTQNA